MYAMQRKTENLRQALLVLGLDATISLALSFSLLKSWQSDDAEGGLDYALFWRRNFLTATASQALVKAVDIAYAEELFLTSLIQDIGIMALDRTLPDLYTGIGSDQMHQEVLIARERELLGVDHAQVGGWLLQQWNFPERIHEAVTASHAAQPVAKPGSDGLYERCVTLSSLVAEVFLEEPGERDFAALAAAADQYLSLDKEALGELLSAVSGLIPDAEAVFQTEILASGNAESILQEARDALMVRNLSALRTVSTLQDRADQLEQRTRRLEEKGRRDDLTGLYNRAYLDEFLDLAFIQSASSDKPLSVAFADLDRFKSINDNHGHPIGDQVLVTTAEVLKANVRGADVVARYGGEEFVLVFPDTDQQLVNIICQRIVSALQDTPHDVGGDQDVAVTISIGTATHNDGRQFDNSQDFVKAADKALYTAKLQGRNRSVPYDEIAEGKLASM